MALWSNKDTFAITGTVSVSNATTVTGNASTLFTTELKAGQTILIASVKYKIASITDINHLELVIPYVGTASGATITRSTIPSYVPQSDLQYMYFVDETEAGLVSNHNKGINGGGWWKVVEYVDSDGSPRYKTECLVSMGTPDATSGDASDNTTVPNAESVITISVQPVAQSTTVALSAATFAVTAANVTGTLAYQWQKASAATPNKFSNVANVALQISGATSASLVYIQASALTTANSGDRYRVVISNNAGAAKVVSNAVTLTVAA